MYAGYPGAKDHVYASPCRIRFRPAHVNWISSRLSVNSGASPTWWNRRNSATTVTTTRAATSHRGHVSGSASGLVTRASADSIDGVAATGVDAFPDVIEVAGVRALDRGVLWAEHHVVHLIAMEKVQGRWVTLQHDLGIVGAAGPVGEPVCPEPPWIADHDTAACQGRDRLIVDRRHEEHGPGLGVLARPGRNLQAARPREERGGRAGVQRPPEVECAGQHQQSGHYVRGDAPRRAPPQQA